MPSSLAIFFVHRTSSSFLFFLEPTTGNVAFKNFHFLTPNSKTPTDFILYPLMDIAYGFYYQLGHFELYQFTYIIVNYFNLNSLIYIQDNLSCTYLCQGCLSRRFGNPSSHEIYFQTSCPNTQNLVDAQYDSYWGLD